MLEGLKIDKDYHVVTVDIWKYLYSIYGGTPILRFSFPWYKDERDIEVQLIKLKIFDLPWNQD